MIRWQYRMEVDYDHDLFNALGAEGWECMSVVHTSIGSTWFYFKRPDPAQVGARS